MICSTYRAQFACAVETVDEQLELDRFTIETRVLAHCGRRSNMETEQNIILIGFEPFQSQCTYGLKLALCVPYSDTKSWVPRSFTEVPDCLQTQTPNLNWVQKGAHIKLIRDTTCPEPSICLSKSPGKRTPSRCPNGALNGESCQFPEPSLTCLSSFS